MIFILNIPKMEDEKNFLLKAKNLFKNLKTDPNSVLFSEEKIDNRLLKKAQNMIKILCY